MWEDTKIENMLSVLGDMEDLNVIEEALYLFNKSYSTQIRLYPKYITSIDEYNYGYVISLKNGIWYDLKLK
jgi:hypothetical protein